DLLDLGRGDVLPTGDIHVRQPVHDPVVPVLVPGGQVPGAQPVPGEGTGGGFWIVVVAGEHRRTAHHQFSGPGSTQDAARSRVGEGDLDVWVGLSHRADAGEGVL